MSDRRISTAAARLIRVWMTAPHEPWYAAELAAAAELPAGVLYPLLARLEQARWITGAWEPPDPLAEHRPPRRYYRLTVEGHECAREAFEVAGLPLTVPPVRRHVASGVRRRPVAAGTVAAVLLGAARLRLSGRAGEHIAGEWTAETRFVLVRARRAGLAVRFAAGLVTAAPEMRTAAAVRIAPDPGPVDVRGARRQLRSARRAWGLAARQHARIDPAADPVGETIALHAALYCQLEVDDAQLAYGAACDIADMEQECYRHDAPAQ